MQEDLEQRTVSVSIQAAKLSGRLLRAAVAAATLRQGGGRQAASAIVSMADGNGQGIGGVIGLGHGFEI